VATKLCGVIFDWRGTLVVTPPEVEWCREALSRLGRRSDHDSAAELLSRIERAPGIGRLSASGVDASSAGHRHAYFSVFRDTGLDEDLAASLYAVESDFRFNPFAADAAQTLVEINEMGLRIAILSDIHFDIRPAFAEAGLIDLVDSFVLSFEVGLMKPDLAFFDACLRDIGLAAVETLMVGDRAAYDGAAVAVGCPVLLLPPLSRVEDRRLSLVTGIVRGSNGLR